MDLPAIARVQVVDVVVARIRDAILLGELPPGAMLPSERDLAAQFGVNRTTVREALSRLDMLGLIDRRQGIRCRVLDYRRHGSTELLPALARLNWREVVRSITETVKMIYLGTVRLAAQRADEHDRAELARLAAALEEAVASGEDKRITDAERAFQHAVATAAHSVTLELMFGNYYRTLDRTLDRSGFVRRSIVAMLLDVHAAGYPLLHRLLADAIAAGDVDRAVRIADLMVSAFDEEARPRSAGGDGEQSDLDRGSRQVPLAQGQSG